MPEFVNGNLVRYVLSEKDDELGQAIDLRKTTGDFSGTIQPVIQYEQDSVVGAAHHTSFRIESVKQVVWVNFVASYVGSLRHFGLRAVDPMIRERVLEVAARDYAGTNMEFRQEKPADYALFAQVDLSGPDPNGYGLLGYDNTPGKDVGNDRLYDKIMVESLSSLFLASASIPVSWPNVWRAPIPSSTPFLILFVLMWGGDPWKPRTFRNSSFPSFLPAMNALPWTKRTVECKSPVRYGRWVP